MLLAVNGAAIASSGNVNFLLGTKTLDTNDWAPFEDQAAFGVLFDFKGDDWPVSMAIDVLGSYDEQTILGLKTEASTSEFDIGVRKIWEISGSSVRPFIGGGLAFVRGEIKASNIVTVSVDDNGTGIWINGGVYWTLGQHFNLGLQARYSRAEISIAGIEGEAGGTHAGIMLGYHW